MCTQFLSRQGFPVRGETVHLEAPRIKDPYQHISEIDSGEVIRIVVQPAYCTSLESMGLEPDGLAFLEIASCIGTRSIMTCLCWPEEKEPRAIV